MTYPFVCPECGKKKEIQMLMSQYTSKGHFCECGAEMIRDPSSFSCNFVVKCDGFFGKSKPNN